MKGSALLAVLFAAITPILVLALLVAGAGLGLVLWRPPVIWTDQLGTPSTNPNGFTGIAVSNTSLYAGGYLNATDYFTGVPFVKKYDLGGRSIWNTTIAPLKGYTIVSVAAGNNTAYIIGEGVYNDTLLRLDSNGNYLWIRQLNGVRDAAIYATTNGVYLAGSSDLRLTNQTFTGTISFVREYDLDGNVLWTKEFSNSTGRVYGIYAVPSTVYALTGSSLVSYDRSGNENWLRSGGTGLWADSGGAYVSGEIGSGYAYPVLHGFLRKYDQSGNQLWNLQFDSPDGSGVGSSNLSGDSSGLYLSMGSIAGNGFVMKYEPQGRQLWNFRTPIHPTPLISQIDGFLVAAGGGGFYLAGSTVLPIGNTYSANAIVQQFGQSSSLIFFGINPPWSFMIVAALVAVAGIGIWFFRKRYLARLALRPKSTSPDIRFPQD